MKARVRVMPEITEPLRPVRVLANPKKHLPLRNFSCGRKGSHWEKLVNECVRNLYLGKETLAQTVVVLEDADGKLVGVCTFHPHSLNKFIKDSQRIHVIGTDRLYHGTRLEDGSRLGDVLLLGAIEQIKLASRDGRMPYVSTLITPENQRSRALFSRHGFRDLPYTGEGEIEYVRSPHKQLPVISLRPPAVVRRVFGRGKKEGYV